MKYSKDDVAKYFINELICYDDDNDYNNDENNDNNDNEEW